MPTDPESPAAEPLLDARDLDVLYGDFQILWGARLSARAGEIVAILGPNGAGKSTLMNTVSGLMRPRAGEVRFRGRRIDGQPAHRIVEMGLSHVLERRRLFPYLTVGQNLLLGAYNREARAHREASLGGVEALFPFLRQRWTQVAHTLSGGEQQMVAIARGLMTQPVCVMLDEPSLGLAPKLVGQVAEMIRAIRARGITVMLVEQNARLALELADRAYVLQTGRIALEGPSREILSNQEVRAAYLGL